MKADSGLYCTYLRESRTSFVLYLSGKSRVDVLDNSTSNMETRSHRIGTN